MVVSINQANEALTVIVTKKSKDDIKRQNGNLKGFVGLIMTEASALKRGILAPFSSTPASTFVNRAASGCHGSNRCDLTLGRGGQRRKQN
ncbi:hypothetical protein CDAR_610261 [Caerostris darwini]|uniref:Uncharacterized protein n=1 Tax=Caerostris darwini TaxID=1538125 RepID=A0AAV4N7B9_9ARAC|nr:hypothetical protein CDAR_610261 [Caerostris darwini]